MGSENQKKKKNKRRRVGCGPREAPIWAAMAFAFVVVVRHPRDGGKAAGEVAPEEKGNFVCVWGGGDERAKTPQCVVEFLFNAISFERLKNDVVSCY